MYTVHGLLDYDRQCYTAGKRKNDVRQTKIWYRKNRRYIKPTTMKQIQKGRKHGQTKHIKTQKQGLSDERAHDRVHSDGCFTYFGS